MVSNGCFVRKQRKVNGQMREQPQWMSMHLQRMGGLADDFYFSQCSQPSTNQRTKQPFNNINHLEATNQSPFSGCLIASGRYLPSAADEGSHSPKRPCSTVAPIVSQFYRGKYPFCNTFNFRYTEFLLLCLLLSPLWDQLAPPPVTPFVGPDDILLPLHWMSMHLHRCRAMQGGPADDFYFSHCLHFITAQYCSSSHVRIPQPDCLPHHSENIVHCTNPGHW